MGFFNAKNILTSSRDRSISAGPKQPTILLVFRPQNLALITVSFAAVCWYAYKRWERASWVLKTLALKCQTDKMQSYKARGVGDTAEKIIEYMVRYIVPRRECFGLRGGNYFDGVRRKLFRWGGSYFSEEGIILGEEETILMRRKLFWWENYFGSKLFWWGVNIYSRPPYFSGPPHPHKRKDWQSIWLTLLYIFSKGFSCVTGHAFSKGFSCVTGHAFSKGFSCATAHERFSCNTNHAFFN